MLEAPLKKLIYHNSLFNSKIKNGSYYLLETFNIENNIVYDQIQEIKIVRLANSFKYIEPK